MSSKFAKGTPVNIKLVGFGETSEEAGTVLRVDKKGAWLDNGPGNDPSGPFDPASGRYLGAKVPGFSQSIEPAAAPAAIPPKPRR